jgi:hypothetical protein
MDKIHQHWEESMHYFPSIYKKMCMKAMEIQNLWKEKIQDWDEYCRKDDLEDGFGSRVSLGGMPKEEIDELIKDNIWLPLAYQIREKVFRTFGVPAIRKAVELRYTDYMTKLLEEEDKLKAIREHFKGDEIGNVIALMFVMEEDYMKRWDFDKEEWIEIKR